MIGFKEFCTEQEKIEKFNTLILLFEYSVYKLIPNSNASYREDMGKTTNMTITHSHIYVKPNGDGKELYSINIDGSGHDGFSGTEIPQKHADYFRSKGYDIKDNNILESIILENTNTNHFKLIILEE